MSDAQKKQPEPKEQKPLETPEPQPSQSEPIHWPDWWVDWHDMRDGVKRDKSSNKDKGPPAKLPEWLTKVHEMREKIYGTPEDEEAASEAPSETSEESAKPQTVTDANGETALSLATKSGDKEVMKSLLNDVKNLDKEIDKQIMLKKDLAFEKQKMLKDSFTAPNKAGKTVPAVADIQIGAQMQDGTVYAGVSPDTQAAMFVTPADEPGLLDFKKAKKQAKKKSKETGISHRVPSGQELRVLFNNRAAIGGFKEMASTNKGDFYWTSTACDGFSMWSKSFATGNEEAADFGSVRALRLVRD